MILLSRIQWLSLLQGTLLAHVQPGAHLDPEILVCQAAFFLGDLQHLLVHFFCSSPGAEFWTSCWNWWDSSQPICLACWGLSGWQHNLIANQLLVPVLCPLQTCWGCTLPYNSDHYEEVLYGTGPSTNPWGTPLVTCLQTDFAPLNAELWSQPFSQFSIYFTVCSSSPYVIIFSMRMSWDTVLKAFVKPRWFSVISVQFTAQFSVQLLVQF